MSEIERVELKACPFCGTAAEVVVFGKGQANERHGVRCADLTCGAMVRLGTKPGESVALWNTRTQSISEEVVERYREALELIADGWKFDDPEQRLQTVRERAREALRSTP